MKICKILSTCILPIALSATAAQAMDDAEFNFTTVKVGYMKPKTSSASSSFSLNDSNNKSAMPQVSGANGSIIAGVEFGTAFMERFTASIEYNYYAKSKFKFNSAPTTNTTSSNPSKNSYSPSWSGTSNLLLANFAVNLYPHIENNKFNPYFKLGLGISQNKATAFSSGPDTYNTQNGNTVTTSDAAVSLPGKKKNSFAWRVGLGANIAYNEEIDFDIAYSYTNRGQFKASGITTTTTSTSTYTQQVKLKDNAISLGIRIKL